MKAKTEKQSENDNITRGKKHTDKNKHWIRYFIRLNRIHCHVKKCYFDRIRTEQNRIEQNRIE